MTKLLRISMYNRTGSHATVDTMQYSVAAAPGALSSEAVEFIQKAAMFCVKFVSFNYKSFKWSVSAALPGISVLLALMCMVATKVREAEFVVKACRKAGVTSVRPELRCQEQGARKGKVQQYQNHMLLKTCFWIPRRLLLGLFFSCKQHRKSTCTNAAQCAHQALGNVTCQKIMQHQGLM